MMLKKLRESKLAQPLTLVTLLSFFGPMFPARPARADSAPPSGGGFPDGSAGLGSASSSSPSVNT